MYSFFRFGRSYTRRYLILTCTWWLRLHSQLVSSFLTSTWRTVREVGRSPMYVFIMPRINPSNLNTRRLLFIVVFHRTSVHRSLTGSIVDNILISWPRVSQTPPGALSPQDTPILIKFHDSTINGKSETVTKVTTTHFDTTRTVFRSFTLV